ncbi:uncharacterized protein N7477_001989 [Penicillium maclennaniae]|uniref:uncharacterized protein n=1 Tax=Penicillium maclennaniae TaxID=1343394 RepID=UPI0025402C7C|nr:uncharacterized protein N7477_001989 [Penicillium maclennaniae]KAJ5682049.1 hypothetical protein N7477_001989 [Penicillium maclennaniae]
MAGNPVGHHLKLMIGQFVVIDESPGRVGNVSLTPWALYLYAAHLTYSLAMDDIRAGIVCHI